jgi:hypothetical protein
VKGSDPEAADQGIRGKKTTPQLAGLQERRNALLSRIQRWQGIQSLYMPAVMEATEDVGDHCIAQPETIPLHLPSGMPQTLGSIDGLADKERRLRLAQADDALIELRRLL